jgi:DNA-binding NtrC family response regulator
LATDQAKNTTDVAIVDDEEDIVLIIEQILADLPVKVHSFTDPRKALDYFRQNPNQIRLLITDYRMPQMSGLDFIRSLRGLGETMKIIVGVDQIMPKPFVIEGMMHAVQEQLKGL